MSCDYKKKQWQAREKKEKASLLILQDSRVPFGKRKFFENKVCDFPLILTIFNFTLVQQEVAKAVITLRIKKYQRKGRIEAIFQVL